jgi:hypothetical protein
MTAMACSTVIIAFLSYYVTTVFPQLIQRNLMLDLIVLFMGPVSGAVAGYAAAYLWNRYTHPDSILVFSLRQRFPSTHDSAPRSILTANIPGSIPILSYLCSAILTVIYLEKGSSPPVRKTDHQSIHPAVGDPVEGCAQTSVGPGHRSHLVGTFFHYILKGPKRPEEGGNEHG